MHDPHAWLPEFTSAVALRDGIYRLLSDERLLQIEPFLAQYRRIRAADGYRQPDAAYYRRLPDVDARDAQAATWRVRRESVHHLERLLRRFGGRRARILDLGAGSGWLCYRLSQLGHACVAVDWLDDVEDGLGVFRDDAVRFTRVQADFENLPFAPGQFDVAIFNASLHYASDPDRTLRRAREALAPGGMLVVMDSPVFASDDAGRRMLDAQAVALRARGERLHRWGVGYLTDGRLKSAAREAGLTVAWIPSRGGWRWAVRRWIAGVKQHRVPARFGLWFGVWQPSSARGAAS